MKYIFMFTILLFIAQPLVAQEDKDNYFQIGIGPTTNSNDDYMGTAFYAQYILNMGKSWAIGPKVMYAFGHSSDDISPARPGDDAFSQFGSASLDVDFMYYLRRNERFFLATFLGPSIRYLATTDSNPSFNYNDITEEIIYDPGLHKSEKVSAGFTLGAQASWRVLEKHFLGINAAFRGYSDGNHSPYAAVTWSTVF